jgi:hypothetical protein
MSKINIKDGINILEDFIKTLKNKGFDDDDDIIVPLLCRIVSNFISLNYENKDLQKDVVRIFLERIEFYLESK